MLLPCDCIFVNVHYMKMLGKMILLDQTVWDKYTNIDTHIFLLYVVLLT